MITTKKCAECGTRWTGTEPTPERCPTCGSDIYDIPGITADIHGREARMDNAILQEWHDAVGCATEWTPGSPADRWINRVATAGDALAKDYVKLAERADREAKLAVLLRNKLHEIAGPDVASSINVE